MKNKYNIGDLMLCRSHSNKNEMYSGLIIKHKKEPIKDFFRVEWRSKDNIWIATYSIYEMDKYISDGSLKHYPVKR